MTTTTTITLPVTIAGEQRDVEFSLMTLRADDIRGFSRPVAFGRIGRGAKLHPMSLMAWAFDTREDGLKKGYRDNVRFGGANLVECDGRWFGIQLQGVVLNRQCLAVAWRDLADDDQRVSQHIMEGY